MTPENSPAPSTETTHLPPGTAPVIVVLVTSTFIMILNETILSVALPTLMRDLDISASTAQWLTTGFLLTMAVVIPVTGYLLKRVPLRVLYLTAMALFILGTIIAALADGFGALLLGRVIQAGGTAVMMPLLTTTILVVVPPAHRGRMMGIITIVIAVAPAIGPTVSGLILSALDWRWLFWIVAPVALLALLFGARSLRNVTETEDVRFDVLSLLLSALGFGGLIFGLSQIGEAAAGHSLIPEWIPLTVGALALALFVGRQLGLQRTNSALMDLRTFQSRSFTVSVILVVLVMAALFGSLILLPLYAQQVLGMDTLSVGLMLLPGGVVMGAAAPLVGSLFDRFGPVPLVVPGLVVMAVALWGMAFFDEHTHTAVIVAIHVTLNLGISFVFTPVLTSGLGSLDRSLYAYGSSIVSTLQQVAGAAGTALFVTLMTVGTAAGLEAGEDVTAATTRGVHSAFIAGGIISVVAVFVGLLVRRVPPTEAS